MKNLSLLVFLIMTFFQSFAQLPISWQLGISNQFHRKILIQQFNKLNWNL
jgi:hypothetical protein